MAIGINPTVDFACKKLLGSPEHPAVTLHFLNAMLGGNPQITDVTILNPIVEKEYDADKLSILDILARDAHGHRFNIEVQRTVPAGLRERLTYYAATLLVGQLGEGQSYTDLRPSIGICILDAVMFREAGDLHLDFRIFNAKHQIELTDCLQIHLLELPKYVPAGDNTSIEDPLEQWAFFFRRASDLTAEELQARLPGEVFSEATGILEMIAKDPQQRTLYEERLKMQRDEQARLQAARAEGRAEGEVRGRIRLLQQLLGLPESLEEEFQGRSQDELATLEAELQRRLRQRA